MAQPTLADLPAVLAGALQQNDNAARKKCEEALKVRAQRGPAGSTRRSRPLALRFHAPPFLLAPCPFRGFSHRRSSRKTPRASRSSWQLCRSPQSWTCAHPSPTFALSRGGRAFDCRASLLPSRLLPADPPPGGDLPQEADPLSLDKARRAGQGGDEGRAPRAHRPGAQVRPAARHRAAQQPLSPRARPASRHDDHRAS